MSKHRRLPAPPSHVSVLASQLPYCSAVAPLSHTLPCLAYLQLCQVADHMKKRFGRRPARILSAMLGSKGGVSGGTVTRWAAERGGGQGD